MGHFSLGLPYLTAQFFLGATTLYVCACLRVYMYIHVCIHLCKYVCICIYTHMHAYIRVCAYLFIYLATLGYAQ